MFQGARGRQLQLKFPIALGNEVSHFLGLAVNVALLVEEGFQNGCPRLYLEESLRMSIEALPVLVLV